MSTDDKSTTALPTGGRSSSGIPDDAAATAHDFMVGTIRRSSTQIFYYNINLIGAKPLPKGRRLTLP